MYAVYWHVILFAANIKSIFNMVQKKEKKFPNTPFNLSNLSEGENPMPSSGEKRRNPTGLRVDGAAEGVPVPYPTSPPAPLHKRGVALRRAALLTDSSDLYLLLIFIYSLFIIIILCAG
jgi:hypothetical protein